jgi:hypothetical protein
MKWEDPIVAEVRKTRERLQKEAGGFDAYIKKLQKKEQKHRGRLVAKKGMRTAVARAS